jgi:phosphohistidine phosphatase
VAVRRLVLVRHAKAKDTSPTGDRGRVLSGRGRAQAQALRGWTEPSGPLGSVRAVVVVSYSSRTIETYEIGLEGTPVCQQVVFDARLYNGVRHVGTDELLESLREVDPGSGDLVFVGHNPTMTVALFDLMEDPAAARRALSDGFPKCGVAILSFGDGPPRKGGCALEFFGTPDA